MGSTTDQAVDIIALEILDQMEYNRIRCTKNVAMQIAIEMVNALHDRNLFIVDIPQDGKTHGFRNPKGK